MRTSLRNKLREVRQSGGERNGQLKCSRYLFGHKKFILLFAATYLRRFRREKRLRLKLEEDLVLESKKRSYFEDAINSLHK